MKFKNKTKADKEVANLQHEKAEILSDVNLVDDEKEKMLDEIEVKISAALISNQSDAFSKEIGYLRELKTKGGNAAALFKLKEKLVGKKDLPTEATTVTDPSNGTEITSASGIRHATLDYCCNLLTNREPEDSFIVDLEVKRNLHQYRMLPEPDDSFENLDKGIFNQTYDRLRKKTGHKYDFLFKAGDSLKPALFNLCKRVWETEDLPDVWSKSTLVQLYKGKGSKQDLQSYRFIHMKEDIPKFFGNLVMGCAKEKLLANMSRYQIGTKTGHRAQEHLFVIKSVISLHLKFNKALILSTWDISKFFDSECLIDVMNELYRNELRGKLYRLVYLMNQNTRIKVSTPVGVTEERDTGKDYGKEQSRGQ